MAQQHYARITAGAFMSSEQVAPREFRMTDLVTLVH